MKRIFINVVINFKQEMPKALTITDFRFMYVIKNCFFFRGSALSQNKTEPQEKLFQKIFYVHKLSVINFLFD